MPDVLQRILPKRNVRIHARLSHNSRRTSGLPRKSMPLIDYPYIRSAMSQDDLKGGTPSKRVVVVGGGPAGLIAAGEAARSGAQATLVEKMERPGRKLSITVKAAAT